MRRRELITLIGGAAAWPIVAAALASEASGQRGDSKVRAPDTRPEPGSSVRVAQQPAMPMIGFLSSRSPGESAGVIAAFRRGLGEAGFVEGQNVVIAFRWAEGRYDRLDALAAELVGLRVAVLFAAGGPPSALAAKAATPTIPIVFSAANDPVRLGLVPSLNRPGGNVTGMSTFTSALAAKRLELLKQLVPAAAVMAYVVNPSNPSVELESQEALLAAKALGISLHVLGASTEQELDSAFAKLAGLHADGLVVAPEPFFDSQRERFVSLSARHSVPAIYGFRDYAVAGGLMSYGTSITDSLV
jgi:putative tryptophan/tyrosine transport system substrate-binding protein